MRQILKLKILFSNRKMSNKNGLLTTVQVGTTGELTQDSCFFILKGNPTYIENLAVDTLTANDIVSGTIEANTNIDLNGGILTVSGGELLLDGDPVGGGGSTTLADTLANGNSAGAYDINMNNNNITNLDTITPGTTSQVVVSSSIASSTTPLLTLQTTNPNANTVALGLYKNSASPATGDVAGTVVYQANNASATKVNYGAIASIVGSTTAGAETGTIRFQTVKAGALNTVMEMDGVNDLIEVYDKIDMNANIMSNVAIENCTTITNASSAGLTVQNQGVGAGAPTIRAKAVTTDTANPMYITISKDLNGVAPIANEQIANIVVGADSSTGAGATMSQIRTICQDPTNGAVDAKLAFDVAVNNTLTNYIELDGANEYIQIWKKMNLNNIDIINAREINAQDVSAPTSSGLLVTAPKSLGSVEPAMVLYAGLDRTDISSSGVNFTLRKQITNNAVETLGQINFVGLDSTANIYQAGFLGVSSDNNTAGATDARMYFYVDKAGANTAFLSLDASNNYINAHTHRIVNVVDPINAQDVATKAYVDGSSGSATLATVLTNGNSAGTNSINMNGNDISNVNDITNASGEMNISANDLNLSATGALSVLNIGAVAGITLTSAGACAVNAVGAVQIGTAGLISIGSSADNTEIEKVKFSENAISKVTGASDLTIANVATITNASATMDISATQVNVETVSFIDNTIAKKSGGANLIINDIAEFNTSTPGSLIASKAGINIDTLTGLTDFAGFSAQNLTASTGDVAGVYVNQIESLTGDAIGASIVGVTANTGAGSEAKGVLVQTVLGVDSATGIELTGSLAGTTKRGIYEHFATGGTINTLTNKTGIGADPNTAYQLDVAGLTRIYTTTANPTSLLLENAEAGASANILQIYKNSSTPAVNDVIGNLQFAGNNASLAKHTYANIQGAIMNTTAGAEDGEMRLRTTINSVATDFIHLDGSNALVNINPGSSTVGLNMNDNTGKVLMYADPVNVRSMFKNYPQRYIYDIAGDYTVTFPDPGWNIIRILMTGAGGGGGSGRLDSAGTCYGGGAGSGGNVVECWFDRKELFPDASGALTLYITIGAGGNGGTAITTNATNGNNGSGGGQTTVSITSIGGTNPGTLYYQVLGGNGGSGGTNSAGGGGSAPSWSGGNFGFAGRPGASSSITGQPGASTTASANYCGTICQPPGGSGAGGGVNAGATTAYAGGGVASPAGQYYGVPGGAGLGINAMVSGTAGTAVIPATAGAGFTFTGPLATASIRPLRGNVDCFSGGGGSVNATSGGGDGGGHVAGTAGSRGSGGSGGGGATSTRSGAGGRGRDGLVYISLW